MTTPPQVPAALCGLYCGARVTMTSIPERGAGTVGRQRESGAWPVHFDEGGFGWWTPEVLSFLLDSPLAMCYAARWLATRLGCDPGATAPWWTHYPRGVYCPGDNDPLRPDFWVLLCENGGCVWFVDADEPDDLKVDQDGNRYISVAGLKGSTLPAALAAACVAVGGAS